MKAKTHGLSRSVHARLVQRAQSLGVDANLLLTRFATERFLYRLSRTPYAERFVLKGALLMLVWLGETIRPTRDADLLGFGEPDELEKIIGSISKFMEPAINAASTEAPLAKTWRPGGPWKRIESHKEGDVNA